MDRREELRGAHGKVKVPRQHADYGVLRVVENHGLSDNVLPPSETVLPRTCVNTTVRGAAGLSSALVKARPSIAVTPRLPKNRRSRGHCGPPALLPNSGLSRATEPPILDDERCALFSPDSSMKVHLRAEFVVSTR